jgi:prepilin-type N-terminal cleavage/methylation domain-containing protein
MNVSSFKFPPRGRTVAAGRVSDFKRHAFTLIEIMVVVGILGMVMAMGFPAIYRMVQKESLTKAVNEVLKTCEHARTQAIMSGQPADAVFHPLEKRMDVAGGGATRDDESGSATPVSGTSAQLPDNITLEGLGINWLDWTEAEEAHVRFYPNGTCDEMVLVLRSDRNVYRLISLEITTGLASVETELRRFR